MQTFIKKSGHCLAVSRFFELLQFFFVYVEQASVAHGAAYPAVAEFFIDMYCRGIGTEHIYAHALLACGGSLPFELSKYLLPQPVRLKVRLHTQPVQDQVWRIGILPYNVAVNVILTDIVGYKKTDAFSAFMHKVSITVYNVSPYHSGSGIRLVPLEDSVFDELGAGTAHHIVNKGIIVIFCKHKLHKRHLIRDIRIALQR